MGNVPKRMQEGLRGHDPIYSHLGHGARVEGTEGIRERAWMTAIPGTAESYRYGIGYSDR